MIKFKIDVLAELKANGVTAANSKGLGIIGQSAFTKMRHGEIPSAKTLDTVCKILRCQPGDLLEWVED